MADRRRGWWLALWAAAAMLGWGPRPVAADLIQPGYVAAFEHFDRELKAAISAENVEALALLVHFPLRVGHPDGTSLLLDNPRAFASHYAAVFTPEVRKALLATGPGSYFFKNSKVAYGAGKVWVERYPTEGEDAVFRIRTVNVGEVRASDKSLQLEFVCTTTRERILIDDNYLEHVARLRLWKRPKPLLEAPDLVLDGIVDADGTGECRGRFWLFASDAATIEVTEAGPCGPGDEPAGYVGELTLTGKDGSRESRYCF